MQAVLQQNLRLGSQEVTLFGTEKQELKPQQWGKRIMAAGPLEWSSGTRLLLCTWS